MRGLDGKVVIVTGAASGIGWATTVRLLAEGARVVAADLKAPTGPSAGAPTPSGLAGAAVWERAASTGQLTSVAVDVTDETQVASMVDEAARFGGRLHGAVHAAGVAGGGAVHQLALEEWLRVVGINLTGTFLVAKHVIGRLLEQEPLDGSRGALVNLASIEGLEGTAGGSAYCASKGGVVLLTKSMAIDYGALGIRVNAICPGFIETPMTAGVFGLAGMEETRHLLIEEHKLRRMGHPEEIAAAAAYLLSEDATFLTGHTLTVDGGYTAGRDHGVTGLLGLRDT